jgi:serine/threonine-protein kinase
VVAGKYRVDRLLGEGGMGCVVVATHLQLEQRVALKFMRHSPGTASIDAIRRFVREARAAARIQSEHVARVSDVGTLDNGAPYLVMEYLEGQDLDSRLRASPKLPVDLAIEYAMQACEGLAEVHVAGIVHRDLKPANLFLSSRTDGSVRVKLLDFGISKVSAAPGAVADGAMTSTQALMGSPLYMAPEQMRSSKTVDARADIWSMGVILFEMLAGHAPFSAETLPEICARILADPPAPLRESRPDAPASLEAVILRCLEKAPSVRYQDVSELARALAPFGQSEAYGAADRIERVQRGRSPSSTPSGTTTAAAEPRPRREVAQTAATFGTVESSPPIHRSMRLPLAAGGIVLAIAGLVAAVAIHGGNAAPAALGALPGSVLSAASLTASAARAPATVIVELTPKPAESVEAIAPPGAASGASTATHAEPPATASARTHPRHLPPAPPPPPSAKPATTSGFGGRD